MWDRNCLHVDAEKDPKRILSSRKSGRVPKTLPEDTAPARRTAPSNMKYPKNQVSGWIAHTASATPAIWWVVMPGPILPSNAESTAWSTQAVMAYIYQYESAMIAATNSTNPLRIAARTHCMDRENGSELRHGLGKKASNGPRSMVHMCAIPPFQNSKPTYIVGAAPLRARQDVPALSWALSRSPGAGGLRHGTSMKNILAG